MSLLSIGVESNLAALKWKRYVGLLFDLNWYIVNNFVILIILFVLK